MVITPLVIASQHSRHYDRDSNRALPERKSGALLIEPNDSIYEHLRNSFFLRNRRFITLFAKATPVDCTTSVLSASSFQTKHHFLTFSSHLRLGLLSGQTFERYRQKLFAKFSVPSYLYMPLLCHST